MTNKGDQGGRPEPDYRSYTTSELLDVEKRIDRERFPERSQRLQQELANRSEAGEPLELSDKLYPPDSEKLRRRIQVGAAVNSVYAVAVFGLILYGLASSNEIMKTLPSLGLPLVLVAGLLYLGLLSTAYAFYCFEYWPRLILWPTSVLGVLNGSLFAVPVSLFTLWVLFTTRPESPPEDKSAA